MRCPLTCLQSMVVESNMRETWSRSEHYLERELGNSGFVSAIRAHKEITAGRTGIYHATVERRELRVIEDIEHFSPELHIYVLYRFERFIYRHVELGPVRKVQAVTS